ncbi:L-histidine N(alpha)-methyltransferase [Paraburkholderia sp. DHOC27]|uniref:L-histidine N(alpha)-methyltransferase n=1 Tax=Paraburkholderia sp. DHOC27 TaxID=2303330 RepID=UPI00286F0889|nr:L-histidine N(alpha)-methyltransferase [Paraburkholderia sp. DHOC27]
MRLARDVTPQGATDDDSAEFARHVQAGLASTPKALSPKYFYDANGSAIFEEICATPEYYPTRAETALLGEIVGELDAYIGANATLVEFGSGASEKTRIILDRCTQIDAYVPVDISTTALEQAVARLKSAYPALRVLPLAGDFTQPLASPLPLSGAPRTGFFPGSTIGNFTYGEGVALLRAARNWLGSGSHMIVGVDIVKDTDTLLAAYDDALGVTARFNKNLLVRINREAGGEFDLDTFEHAARWNAALNRIEMHLVSKVNQIVRVGGRSFGFEQGESIHTENSHKFTVASFGEMANAAGWTVARHWVSDAPAFAVFVLRDA